MLLAPDTIRISIDGHAVDLRPSLRAATRLEAKHGFRTIFEGITSGSLTIMAGVIEIAGDYPGAVASIIRDIDKSGIVRLDVLKAPLIELLTQMVEAGETRKKGEGDFCTAPPTASEANTQSFGDHYAHLFRTGTGWLGWTPEQTWHATPAEIMAAYDGRIDLLKAIFGGKDDKPAPAPSKGTLSSRFKAVFAGLGTTKVARAA
jgi:hypothetical protein